MTKHRDTARPPSITCPACHAAPGQWCHDEEHRVCVTRAIRGAAGAQGRDAMAEAVRLRRRGLIEQRAAVAARSERR